MSTTTLSPTYIPYARQTIDENDIEAVNEVLRNEFLTQGPRVPAFEHDLAEATGAREAVVVSSGTAALHLAVKSLLGEGPSVVLVPAITFVATANAALYCGADVVFIDVDPATGLMDVNHLAASLERLAMQPYTDRLIVPVSFAGRMPDLKSIRELAERHGARVIEDAAHSLGATADDDPFHRSGSCELTDAAILSFHPVKHICSGEGGAILTNDTNLARRLRTLRTHGVHRPHHELGHPGYWYEESELGYAYRMPDILAALGRSQLRKLPDFLARRREIARRYEEVFADAYWSDHLERPELTDGHAWHLYPVRFRRPGMRDKVFSYLRAIGFGVQVHYIPVYRQPVYQQRCGEVRLPGAETWFERCLSLPMFPGLREEEQDAVQQRLAEFLSTR